MCTCRLQCDCADDYLPLDLVYHIDAMKFELQFRGESYKRTREWVESRNSERVANNFVGANFFEFKQAVSLSGSPCRTA